MTREQYLLEATIRSNKAYVESFRMPELLRNMAIWCFINYELNTPFADTTRVRLRELETYGELKWI